MNDIMLYTYPQQDGKYRLKNTLSLSGMKVRLFQFSGNRAFLFIWPKWDMLSPLTHRWANLSWTMSWTVLRLTCLTSPSHFLPGEQHANQKNELYISCKTPRARCDCVCVCVFSSVGEREDWFHTLSRAIADHAAGLCTFGGPCSEVGKITRYTLRKQSVFV